MNTLATIGSVFLVIAALIHVLIFVTESVRWSRPEVWKRFGVTTQVNADIVKPMAFNQGFYNLFLAIGAGLGPVLLVSTPVQQAGLAVSLFAGSSMVLAALVLIISSPKMARAAFVQGLAPLIGIVFLVFSVLLA
jgi:putative membrane protein